MEITPTDISVEDVKWILTQTPHQLPFEDSVYAFDDPRIRQIPDEFYSPTLRTTMRNFREDRFNYDIELMYEDFLKSNTPPINLFPGPLSIQSVMENHFGGVNPNLFDPNYDHERDMADPGRFAAIGDPYTLMTHNQYLVRTFGKQKTTPEEWNKIAADAFFEVFSYCKDLEAETINAGRLLTSKRMELEQLSKGLDKLISSSGKYIQYFASDIKLYVEQYLTETETVTLEIKDALKDFERKRIKEHTENLKSGNYKNTFQEAMEDEFDSFLGALGPVGGPENVETQEARLKLERSLKKLNSKKAQRREAKIRHLIDVQLGGDAGLYSVLREIAMGRKEADDIILNNVEKRTNVYTKIFEWYAQNDQETSAYLHNYIYDLSEWVLHDTKQMINILRDEDYGFHEILESVAGAETDYFADLEGMTPAEKKELTRKHISITFQEKKFQQEFYRDLNAETFREKTQGNLSRKWGLLGLIFQQKNMPYKNNIYNQTQKVWENVKEKFEDDDESGLLMRIAKSPINLIKEVFNSTMEIIPDLIAAMPGSGIFIDSLEKMTYVAVRIATKAVCKFINFSSTTTGRYTIMAARVAFSFFWNWVFYTGMGDYTAILVMGCLMLADRYLLKGVNWTFDTLLSPFGYSGKLFNVFTDVSTDEKLKSKERLTKVAGLAKDVFKDMKVMGKDMSGVLTKSKFFTALEGKKKLGGAKKAKDKAESKEKSKKATKKELKEIAAILEQTAPSHILRPLKVDIGESFNPSLTEETEIRSFPIRVDKLASEKMTKLSRLDKLIKVISTNDLPKDPKKKVEEELLPRLQNSEMMSELLGLDPDFTQEDYNREFERLYEEFKKKQKDLDEAVAEFDHLTNGESSDRFVRTAEHLSRTILALDEGAESMIPVWNSVIAEGNLTDETLVTEKINESKMLFNMDIPEEFYDKGSEKSVYYQARRLAARGLKDSIHSGIVNDLNDTLTSDVLNQLIEDTKNALGLATAQYNVHTQRLKSESRKVHQADKSQKIFEQYKESFAHTLSLVYQTEFYNQVKEKMKANEARREYHFDATQIFLQELALFRGLIKDNIGDEKSLDADVLFWGFLPIGQQTNFLQSQYLQEIKELYMSHKSLDDITYETAARTILNKKKKEDANITTSLDAGEVNLSNLLSAQETQGVSEEQTRATGLLFGGGLANLFANAARWLFSSKKISRLQNAPLLVPKDPTDLLAGMAFSYVGLAARSGALVYNGIRTWLYYGFAIGTTLSVINNPYIQSVLITNGLSNAILIPLAEYFFGESAAQLRDSQYQASKQLTKLDQQVIERTNQHLTNWKKSKKRRVEQAQKRRDKAKANLERSRRIYMETIHRLRTTDVGGVAARNKKTQAAESRFMSEEITYMNYLEDAENELEAIKSEKFQEYQKDEYVTDYTKYMKDYTSIINSKSWKIRLLDGIKSIPTIMRYAAMGRTLLGIMYDPHAYGTVKDVTGKIRWKYDKAANAIENAYRWMDHALGWIHEGGENQMDGVDAAQNLKLPENFPEPPPQEILFGPGQDVQNFNQLPYMFTMENDFAGNSTMPSYNRGCEFIDNNFVLVDTSTNQYINNPCELLIDKIYTDMHQMAFDPYYTSEMQKSDMDYIHYSLTEPFDLMPKDTPYMRQYLDPTYNNHVNFAKGPEEFSFLNKNPGTSYETVFDQMKNTVFDLPGEHSESGIDVRESPFANMKVQLVHKAVVEQLSGYKPIKEHMRTSFADTQSKYGNVNMYYDKWMKKLEEGDRGPIDAATAFMRQKLSQIALSVVIRDPKADPGNQPRLKDLQSGWHGIFHGLAKGAKNPEAHKNDLGRHPETVYELLKGSNPLEYLHTHDTTPPNYGDHFIPNSLNIAAFAKDPGTITRAEHELLTGKTDMNDVSELMSRYFPGASYFDPRNRDSINHLYGNPTTTDAIGKRSYTDIYTRISREKILSEAELTRKVQSYLYFIYGWMESYIWEMEKTTSRTGTYLRDLWVYGTNRADELVANPILHEINDMINQTAYAHTLAQAVSVKAMQMGVRPTHFSKELNFIIDVANKSNKILMYTNGAAKSWNGHIAAPDPTDPNSLANFLSDSAARLLGRYKKFQEAKSGMNSKISTVLVMELMDMGLTTVVYTADHFTNAYLENFRDVFRHSSSLLDSLPLMSLPFRGGGEDPLLLGEPSVSYNGLGIRNKMDTFPVSFMTGLIFTMGDKLVDLTEHHISGGWYNDISPIGNVEWYDYKNPMLDPMTPLVDPRENYARMMARTEQTTYKVIENTSYIVSNYLQHTQDLVMGNTQSSYILAGFWNSLNFGYTAICAAGQVAIWAKDTFVGAGNIYHHTKGWLYDQEYDPETGMYLNKMKDMEFPEGYGKYGENGGDPQLHKDHQTYYQSAYNTHKVFHKIKESTAFQEAYERPILTFKPPPESKYLPNYHAGLQERKYYNPEVGGEINPGNSLGGILDVINSMPNNNNSSSRIYEITDEETEEGKTKRKFKIKKQPKK